MFNVSGVVNSLNKIVEKLGALLISIGGDDADYVCHAYPSANQNIANSTATKIQLNTKEFDPENSFDTTNYKWTCPKTGYYQLGTHLRFEQETIGYEQLVIYKNGNAFLEDICDAGNYEGLTIATTIYLEKGDYLEMYVNQTSGGNAIVKGTARYTHFSIAKINKYSGGGSQPNGEGWLTVQTFLNSWVNYGGTTPNAAYWKDQFGVVHLKGLIKSGTIANPAFTLPAGYRPANNEYFAINANNAFASLTVAPTGNVTPNNGSNAWVSLAGITFRADGY